MRGKSLLNEKAIIILSLNQSECRKLLRSASSRIGFSRDTGIEASACKSSCRPLFLAITIYEIDFMYIVLAFDLPVLIVCGTRKGRSKINEQLFYIIRLQ